MGESLLTFQPKNRGGSVFVKGLEQQLCVFTTVALSQLNVADINFNASSIIAVVDQEACVIIDSVHLVMFVSGSQHIAGHSITAAIQEQAL